METNSHSSGWDEFSLSFRMLMKFRPQRRQLHNEPATPFNICLEVVKPIWYPFYLIFEHSLHPVWSYLCPLSTYHEERRENKRLEAAAKRLDDEFKQLQVKNQCPIPATNAPAYPSGPLFTKVPPDVRRQILIEAFGAQTVHLDLDMVEKAAGQRSVKSWQWMSSRGRIYRTNHSTGDISFTVKHGEIRSHALEAKETPPTQGDVLKIVTWVLRAGFYHVGKGELILSLVLGFLETNRARR
ncbi:unnamed protein product [Clonostachys solani]|uniref:Uncharacterized protein n=1 Tax=Clonostachys solani TaxID=160281 RepID=A0A9N9ZL85_9HYPO|nr:unnamed protein product [Clonostachys solani]